MPKKEKIRNLFDDIATDYDRLNHILSLDIDKIWRRRAVKEIIRKDRPQEILDVACGTGDFAIAVAKEAPEASHITGIDLSEGMLSIGRDKVSAAGFSGRISMEQGDCEALPYNDCRFDTVSVAFGIRNFEHKETGLEEMFRVLKPGGKVVILELSIPDSHILQQMYKIYFLHILPAIGGAVSGNRGAYRYLPASVLKFPKQDVFLGMMSAAGFSEVRVKSFTCGICRMYIGERH